MKTRLGLPTISLLGQRRFDDQLSHDYSIHREAIAPQIFAQGEE
jgi:hypothetical protein